MSELAERHLEGVGARMGRFLRGFDDPTIHLGMPWQFAREFRKVLELPVLHTANAGQMSYARAVREARVTGLDAQLNDPVGILVQGLRGPSTLSSDHRLDLRTDLLTGDLASLLRVPGLRLYVQTFDQQRLLAELNDLASRRGYQAAISRTGEAPPCPRCGDVLLRGGLDSPFSCLRCRTLCETLVVLPLSCAMAGVLSFDFLRAMVALDVVTTYQESGDVRPIDAFEGA